MLAFVWKFLESREECNMLVIPVLQTRSHTHCYTNLPNYIYIWGILPKFINILFIFKYCRFLSVLVPIHLLICINYLQWNMYQVIICFAIIYIVPDSQEMTHIDIHSLFISEIWPASHLPPPCTFLPLW